MIFILILTMFALLIYGMVQAGVHEGERLFDFEPLIEMTREVIFVLKKGVKKIERFKQHFSIQSRSWKS